MAKLWMLKLICDKTRCQSSNLPSVSSHPVLTTSSGQPLICFCPDRTPPAHYLTLSYSWSISGPVCRHSPRELSVWVSHLTLPPSAHAQASLGFLLVWTCSLFNKVARLIRKAELFFPLLQKVGNLNNVMYKMDTENYLLNKGIHGL